MRKTDRIRGHTLIEAMFASFLALICALIFAATIPVANLTRGKADNLSAATSLAQKMMESVRGEGYPNTTNQRLFEVGLADSTALITTASAGCGPVGESALEFSGIDSGLVDSPSSVLPEGRGFIKSEQVGLDVRRVTVIICWSERSSVKSIRLSSLVANL